MPRALAAARPFVSCPHILIIELPHLWLEHFLLFVASQICVLFHTYIGYIIAFGAEMSPERCRLMAHFHCEQPF